MAFKDGIELNTCNTTRYCVAAGILFFYLKARGKQIYLLPRERNISLTLGISVFMMGIGYLGATQYIPVSLAVLIFYTAPFFIAIVSRFTENEPITIARLTAILLALTGLTLALDVQSIAVHQIIGIMFAFVAALGFTSFAVISSLMIRNADPQAVLFHSLTAGGLAFLLFGLITGYSVNVVTQAGWLKVVGSGIALAVGYAAFFAGIEIVGPVKASMMLNNEPVLTIILASILIGEHLSNKQFFGAGLVIVGIILITYTPSNQ
jgi:drug/metabolite transporter (DMT)-like permease